MPQTTSRHSLNFGIYSVALLLLCCCGPSLGSRCCLVPDFLNENIAPGLVQCQQECGAFVQYATTQSCILNSTCEHAMADFTTAMNLAVKRLSVSQVCTSDFRVCFPGVSCLGGECNPGPNTMSIPCELALRRAVCAYHFPRCVNDYLIFSYEVCRETCEDVSIYCNITLDEVVNIPRCTDRNFGCTGGAGMLGLTKWATLAMSMIGWRITHLYM
mmetsp:Transcript_22879/g.74666  ORF Transcript_22879/g.74666 Transcript_22879/m.74666 type:complete len:215 (-) Transcript_22879:104-748(-)